MKRFLSLLLAALIVCMGLVPCLAAANEKPYDNVILMIGDGMGPNHLELAKQERGCTLFMEEQCDLRGFSKTRSSSSAVTAALLRASTRGVCPCASMRAR